MMKWQAKLFLVAGVLVLSAMLTAPAEAKLTGAIWTTLCDGSRVDHNVYAAKEDVYLNAGPTGESGAWVPDGDYYFMVTDPPGKTLLSTDTIGQRKVQIEGGKVLEPVGGYTDHAYCEDSSRPAGSSTFSRRNAFSTSVTVSWRAASASRSIQTRIA